MAKGKFEVGQKSWGRNSGDSERYAGKDKASSGNSRGVGKWPILAAIAGVAVLAVGIVFIAKSVLGGGFSGVDGSAVVSTTIRGMTRIEVEQKANDIGVILNRDLVLTLIPEFDEDAELSEEERNIKPIRFNLSRSDTGVEINFSKLYADLDAEAAQGKTVFAVDLLDYLTLDEEKLRAAAKRVTTEFNIEKKASIVTLEDMPEDESGEDGEDSGDADPSNVPIRLLVIQLGVAGREVSEEDILETLKTAYESVVAGKDPDQAFQPTLSYRLDTLEETLDVDALWEKYCKDPVEPSFDPQTGEVMEGRDGYGFDRKELNRKLDAAQAGDEITIRLMTLKPEKDAQSLRDSLFKDVLAEAHTPHSDNWNRTINLKLACEAVNGTVILPGQIFSFNEVVGERTEEKGYKEAIAYVSGESVPDLGGGICQVASSIYYAVLQADLETVERAPHLYKVDYVPGGMDATIYWGSHDYKFRNNSEYPIKIEASVFGQQVNIILRGTEWKDYTLELSSKEIAKENWKEVTKDVPRDGSYYEGEVISTPYYGYTYAVYKTIYDKDGNKIETTEIGVSEYSKRDKVVAHLVDQPKPTEPKPTEPKPTEPKPTEPKPTEPKPTEPKPTEPKPTEPKPTEPKPTEPKPTEPQPTQPQPTEPQPTQPQPTQPQPTQPQPTEPEPSRPQPIDTEADDGEG